MNLKWLAGAALTALANLSAAAGTYRCPGDDYPERLSPAQAAAIGCRPLMEARASRELTADLRAHMLEALKDPYSAKVLDETLRIGEDGQTVSLCGSVNARNAFGGYAGRSGFISSSNGQLILQSAEPAALFDAAWRVWCATSAR